MSAPRKNHLLIVQLLSDLTLTDTQRAEIAHCSRKTIRRVRAQFQRELQQEGLDDESVVEEFQRHLKAQLPVEECVDKLIEIIRQDYHRPSQLAAIKRYQELLGVVTAKEAKKAEETRPQGPLMIFPPGSQPILRVSSPHALDEQSSASEPIEAEVVRVEGEDDAR